MVEDSWKIPITRGKSDSVSGTSPSFTFRMGEKTDRSIPKKKKRFSRTTSTVVTRFRQKKPVEMKRFKTEETKIVKSFNRSKSTPAYSKDYFILPNYLANMIFNLDNQYFTNFLLKRTENKKFKTILKSYLEFAIVQDYSVEIISSILQTSITNDESYSITKPVITVTDGEGKPSRVLVSNSPISYNPFVIIQCFVYMKSTLRIKHIDLQSNKLIQNGFNKNEDNTNNSENDNTEKLKISESENNETKTTLANNSLLYKVINEFINMDNSNEEFTKLLKICIEIIEFVTESSKNESNYEISQLYNSIADILDYSNYSSKEQDDILYWLFIYPLFNLTPILTRRRSKMKSNTFRIYVACIYIINYSCLHSKDDKHIFTSISEEDKKLIGEIKDYSKRIKKILGCTQVKGLGDTVLNICAVQDEDKCMLVLLEVIQSNIQTIWNELLENTEENSALLLEFVPFIRCGINESK